MKTGTLILIAAFVAAIGAVFLITVPDWMRPPHSQEMGYRGLNMIQFTEPGTKNPLDALPAPIPASVEIPAGGFKNVQVLKGESPQQFMRLQYALTEWVSPQQGCGFCHTGNDFASDANPHKLVARRMLQMTQYINSDWKSHVGQVGVTCYTCHRGQPMPPKAWFLDTPLPRTGILGAPSVFKETAHTVRDFFPNAGWEEYYLQNNPIHVESRTVTPTGDTSTASEAARVYEMMMQMSDGMGVNCTYCHNSTNFSDWASSPPPRWTALYGFRMTAQLNQRYVWPLRNVMPQARLGPNPVNSPTHPPRELGALDGNGLVNCATCHVGAPKPLQGANLLSGFPELAVAPPARVAALGAGSSGNNRGREDQAFLQRYAAERPLTGPGVGPRRRRCWM